MASQEITREEQHSNSVLEKLRSVLYRYTTAVLLSLFVLGLSGIFGYINHQQNVLIHSITQQEEELYKEIINKNLSLQSSQLARSLLMENIFNQSRDGLQQTFFILAGNLGFFLFLAIFIIRKLKNNSYQLSSFAERLQRMNKELQNEMYERDKAAKQLEALNGELKYQSLHDVLTKLPNRRLFEDRLNACILSSKRNKSTFAVMFLDLDGFKVINDTLGHDLGDLLLVEVASRLTKMIRQMDTVARLGGDEFACILSSLEKPELAAVVANRILQAFDAPFLIGEHKLNVNTSIGITIYPDDSDTSQMLLKNADIAMYHAKSLGRGNFQFYREELNMVSKRELLLRNDLERAIQNSELAIYYQPIVDIESHSIVHFEALLRWDHSKLGHIPPLEIIKLANHLGLNLKLGEWILRTVCDQLKAWKSANTHIPQLCVNISLLELESEGFADKVISTLASKGLESSRIILELTESAFNTNPNQIAKVVKQLSEKGVKVAIDDFGAGHFPLNYFSLLPLHILKIDKSFVDNLTNQNHDAIAIVRAVLALAKAFHLEVIAEGVETQEQLKILIGLGCKKIQGFLFSKPIPAKDCLNVEISRKDLS